MPICHISRHKDSTIYGRLSIGATQYMACFYKNFIAIPPYMVFEASAARSM
jgi:hypothetical protein